MTLLCNEMLCDRSEDRLSEQERQLKEREAELAEALAALKNSRKALEGAAAFVQVTDQMSSHRPAAAWHARDAPKLFGCGCFSKW